MERIALIDFDIPAHAVSSACDGKYYKVHGRSFQYKKDAIEFCKEEDFSKDDILTKYQPESWGDTRYSLNSFVDDILRGCGCTFHEGFLTGSNNFRYDVATILPYKGERSKQHVPHHLDACKKHLEDCHGAVLVDGYEADDALGIAQKYDGSTVICSIDKDLLMIPGLHYNWNSKEFTEVSEVEGYRNFFKQMLLGDKQTDNILGIHGVGAKSAHVKKIDGMDSWHEMYDHVSAIYSQYFGNYAPAFMNETGKLLWIWRKHNDDWMDYGYEREG